LYLYKKYSHKLIVRAYALITAYKYGGPDTMKFKARKTDKNKKSGEDANLPSNLLKEDKISQVLALPEGTFRNFPLIEIRGNREITVEGCTGLLSYAKENILLETRYCRIKITGRTLSLNNLTRNILAIRGFIQNVEFTM
jgi:sporulation protein YqfC